MCVEVKLLCTLRYDSGAEQPPFFLPVMHGFASSLSTQSRKQLLLQTISDRAYMSNPKLRVVDGNFVVLISLKKKIHYTSQLRIHITYTTSSAEFATTLNEDFRKYSMSYPIHIISGPVSAHAGTGENIIILYPYSVMTHKLPSPCMDSNHMVHFFGSIYLFISCLL